MDKMAEHVIRQLLSALKCTTCGRSYHETDINVMAHKDNAWFINVRCSFCGSRNFVAAVIKETEDGPATSDLTPAERVRFASTPAVNANDVLKIHYFLEEFDGNFKSLFGPPSL